MTGSKKRKQEGLDELVDRRWCWYCERDFDDEKVLHGHQKVKHFRCGHCHKQMDTASGLQTHSTQVHKITLDKIANVTVPGRDTFAGNDGIFGSQGIPPALMAAHIQRVTDLYKARQAQHFAATGNPPPGTVTGQHETKRQKLEKEKEGIKERVARLKAEKKAAKAAKESGLDANSEGITPGSTQALQSNQEMHTVTSPVTILASMTFADGLTLQDNANSEMAMPSVPLSAQLPSMPRGPFTSSNAQQPQGQATATTAPSQAPKDMGLPVATYHVVRDNISSQMPNRRAGHSPPGNGVTPYAQTYQRQVPSGNGYGYGAPAPSNGMSGMHVQPPPARPWPQPQSAYSMPAPPSQAPYGVHPTTPNYSTQYPQSAYRPPQLSTSPPQFDNDPLKYRGPMKTNLLLPQRPSFDTPNFSKEDMARLHSSSTEPVRVSPIMSSPATQAQPQTVDELIADYTPRAKTPEAMPEHQRIPAPLWRSLHYIREPLGLIYGQPSENPEQFMWRGLLVDRWGRLVEHQPIYDSYGIMVGIVDSFGT